MIRYRLYQLLLTQHAHSLRACLASWCLKNHSNDQNSLRLLFIPPSALIQQVASFQPCKCLDKSSKQPKTYKVQNLLVNSRGMDLGLRTVALSTLWIYSK